MAGPSPGAHSLGGVVHHLSGGSIFVLILVGWGLWSLIGHGARRSGGGGHGGRRPPGMH